MYIIIGIIIGLVNLLVGFQVSLQDFTLLTRKYNYKFRPTVFVSYLAGLWCVIMLVFDFASISTTILIVGIISIIGSILVTWLISKISSKSIWQTVSLMIVVVFIMLIVQNCYANVLFLATPYIILGLYCRNNLFGFPHKKDFLLLRGINAKQKIKPKSIPTKYSTFLDYDILPDFSFAGNQTTTVDLPIYNVFNYNIYPNTKEDLIEKVQALIDKVGKDGGGIIYFPKGKYLFNKSNLCCFIQINYSNIIIEGEIDKNGRPLTTLENCSKTTRKAKNPWLNPFFITTGEKLQESNIFWGIPFKKPLNITTQSSSLADPGSDGEILSPKAKTKVVQDTCKGQDIIYVEDSSILGNKKYIILAMFNTSEDGNLVKDILAVDFLRPEWKTSLRAGYEQAPSFQHLLEIKRVINEHQIQLTQPLRRDCLLLYAPEVYPVQMLENIYIRNLRFNSRWNGLFRHHGFPLYYSVVQTQEMDYGWNAVNFKRVAHGGISNVIIENFTNPLYITDSRNNTFEHIEIKGHDGHQGIKLYEHACDNLIKDVIFRNHYADMMGGEGNAYGNVFTNISYLNPFFKPVDFDFHGFSEGPMSPPSYNLFERIYGFRYINAGGALYNQPACARQNVWWNIVSEGERSTGNLFLSLPYMQKSFIKEKLSLIKYALVISIQKKKFSLTMILSNYRSKQREEQEIHIEPQYHHLLFAISILSGYQSTAQIAKHPRQTVFIENWQSTTVPESLYEYQKNKKR